MTLTASQTVSAGPARLALQRLTFSDPAVTTERGLFVHLDDLAHLRGRAGEVTFGAGGIARFNTFMNLFNLRLWAGQCALDGLWLWLAGEGRFGLRVWHVIGADMAEETLLEEVIDLSPEGIAIDLFRRLGCTAARRDHVPPHRFR